MDKVTAQCFYCDTLLNDDDAIVVIGQGKTVTSCGDCYSDIIRPA